MSKHIGSHVDAPRHFIPNTKTVSEYCASDWYFEKPVLIDTTPVHTQIVEPDDVELVISDTIHDADLVLLRTGAYEERCSTEFYKKQAGFSPGLCSYFLDKFESFCAIGLNAISISSFRHRHIGRLAHKQFLGNSIRIFEDLALFYIHSNAPLDKVIALPFRYKDADGSPVTVLGDVSDNQIR